MELALWAVFGAVIGYFLGTNSAVRRLNRLYQNHCGQHKLKIEAYELRQEANDLLREAAGKLMVENERLTEALQFYAKKRLYVKCVACGKKGAICCDNETPAYIIWNE